MKLYFVADEGLDIIEIQAFLLEGFIAEEDMPEITAIETDYETAFVATDPHDPGSILDVYMLDYDGPMTLAEIRLFFGC